MHELSLCESIIKIIERHAEKKNFSRVVKVRVALGKKSCASAESLRFYFPIVAKNTCAEGAKIEFVYSPDASLKVVDLEVK